MARAPSRGFRAGIFLCLGRTLLATLPVSVTGAPVVTEVSCIIDSAAHAPADLQRLAKKLIWVEAGSELDTQTLEESVRALKMSKLFDSVAVDSTTTQGGMKIILRLSPARYVRNIRIRGEMPLFESDITKVMTTYVGDMFVPELLTQQDSLITDLYRRQGFLDPQVDISSRARGRDANEVVSVKIEPGRYLRLSELTLQGNHAFCSLRLKRRLASWTTSLIPWNAGRFVGQTLHDDIRDLTEFYRRNGFYDVEIRDSVAIDSTRRSVTVVIRIDEGDRYRVRFSRKHRRGIRRRMLREDISALESGNAHDVGIRKTIRNMKKRYRESGFLEPRIEIHDTTVARRRWHTRRLRFIIDKGTRTVVRSIQIAGNSAIDEESIREQMLTEDRGGPGRRSFVPERLEEDILAIRSRYRNHGFLRARVDYDTTMDEHLVDIAITVVENARTTVDSVMIDSTGIFEEDPYAAIALRSGGPFRSAEVKRDARTLERMASESGYPHVTVTPVIEMKEDSTRARVRFRTVPGPRVFLGEVRYIGAFHTRERVLDNEFELASGQPFGLQRVVQSQRNIRDLRVFNSARFKTIGLREKADTVLVFVHVEETPHYYGRLGGGYDSDRGPFARMKAGDRNVLGLNNEAWVAGEVSLVGYRGESGFLEPRLWGTRTRATAEVYGEKKDDLNQDFGTRKWGAVAGIDRPWSANLSSATALRYERRTLYFRNGASAQDSIDIAS
ncbi:MAG: hypothetical protein GF418_13000, partial [Chitinivibrionales bacterium]|nr:hypothetical protein [Chitinivibrionales bacterium]MBD3396536.1 hypothetical protein [Chitinivibrionales bacterium]